MLCAFNGSCANVLVPYVGIPSAVATDVWAVSTSYYSWLVCDFPFANLQVQYPVRDLVRILPQPSRKVCAQIYALTLRQISRRIRHVSYMCTIDPTLPPNFQNPNNLTINGNVYWLLVDTVTAGSFAHCLFTRAGIWCPGNFRVPPMKTLHSRS